MKQQTPAQILVVDDEAAIRTTLSPLLQRCGYHVAQAASGEQALTYLARHPADLVLLDLIMPGMSGLDVATCARALRPNTAILLLTGSDRLDEVADSGLPYIEKTAPPQKVLDRIEALLTAGPAACSAEQTPAWHVTMLASFAHDVRNMLNIINGSTLLIRRHSACAALPERTIIADRIGAINDAVGQIDAQLAQLASGVAYVAPARLTDLVALARRIAAAHQALNPAHTIRVEAGAVKVQGEWDRVSITRALDNLVANAVKYSPAGGPISIRVVSEPGPAGDWAVMCVCDHGIGIPANALDRIFTPTYRAANVPATSTGKGMGLASVRRLVAAVGGIVQVQSEEGVGSCFTIRLPCCNEVAEAELEAICAPLS
jgi:signal transduction histidine kinase